jgi:hypothetical protein
MVNEGTARGHFWKNKFFQFRKAAARSDPEKTHFFHFPAKLASVTDSDHA